MNVSEVEKLIDETGTAVYRFCRKLCDSQYDAEDLYQQTFLKLMEIDLEIDWDNNPQSLLFSITYRIWKDKQRKFARRQRLAPSQAFADNKEQLVKDPQDIEKMILTSDLTQGLRQVIEELPEKFRTTVSLYYQFETPLEEIAHILKIPKGTVKSRLDKARKLMRKRLEEQGYEYP
jgi:RNA polymerase sigma-70 factor (ECF subfamily)